MKYTFRGRLAALSLLVLLSACAPGRSDPVSGGGGGARSMEEHFSNQVQPRLDFCRTCHIPGGIADVEDGKDFMLSSSKSEDLRNLRASWERLGKNNPTSRILLMASGQETPHTGGAPWPVGSDAYKAMEALLKCFESPTQCVLGEGGIVEELPLLGSKHAVHVWNSYCEGKPDNALLPRDPRTAIQPGVNAGKAVYYNAWWQDCHVNLPEQEQQAKTCGEYRKRRDGGFHFLMDELPGGNMTAEDYDNTWQKWGLEERPDNFDQLYTLRYGLNTAPFPNPYPRNGEDPNAAGVNGGSGQLPLGLRQLKDENGKWTGKIGSGACFQCHGGQIGDPTAGDIIAGVESLGIGNNNYDVLMSGRDNAPWANTILAPILPTLDVGTLFNIGVQQRGQNNAVGAFELLNTILDVDSLGLNPIPVKMFVNPKNPLGGVLDVSHPLAHTQDTPAWWNMGSRPRKFFDAGVSNDSTRIIMAAGPGEFGELISLDGKYYRDRVEQYDQDLEAFFLSLRSPPYPRAINTALAEQGAVIFHGKDLWAAGLDNPRSKPAGGNGSCASCHGVYSPRYVHDENYLESPDLEGVAGHIVALDVIGTDPARSDMLTPTLRLQWDGTFWAYPEGAEGWTHPDEKNPAVELLDDMSPLRPVGVCGWQKEFIGYQAPPLYGVWATAPYLHNGSVPTLEQLLDSSQRRPIWRRQLQTVDGITGFDQRLGEAYDFTAVGWKHEVLACGDMPGNLLLNCNPVARDNPSIVQIVQNLLNSTVSYAGLVLLPDPTPGGFDKRLVYDTRILGNSNAGHDFSDVLTEQERKAVIEYLKTL